ncbi:MAG: threonine--tRNA ligase [Planctomycetes bacterium]|nr:threonine--tRNA ligase [Planctomycetota bacterium]
MIRVRLPDGSTREYPEGTTVQGVADSIGKRLAKAAIAGKVDGRLVDLSHALRGDASVEIVTEERPEGLEVLRHSGAHLMAQAVRRLYPGAKLGVGPVIEDGFYYDVDVGRTLSPDDLPKIEAEMKKIAEEAIPVRRRELSKDEAIRIMQGRGEALKIEMMNQDIPDPTVSCYEQGEFIDLCRGPHVPDTGRLTAFKVLKATGAYWRGDQSKQMLQRLYGTAWATRKDLETYLFRMEEAKKRDHRRLGQELDLFSFQPVAPGAPFFHPKGAIVYNLLIGLMRELYQKYGYQEVVTPQIFDVSLWHTSGHYANYKDKMYFTLSDEREFAVKPMNCPGHTFIYAHSKRSYRELPLRLADFGRLHRLEQSGEIAGLTRVRSFSQDDAHIFCAPEQIESEITGVVKMLTEVYTIFGFSSPRVCLCTRPEKSIGSEEMWQKAEAALAAALQANGIAYAVAKGDGAFYGPKIDYQVRDALNREHQLATIQLDFSLPERFDLRYTSAADREERPVMIHRAILGSLERFFGVYLEHCAGNFPVWLAPVQVAVLPIADAFNGYAREVAEALAGKGLRVKLDDSNHRASAKIAIAQQQKVPYMAVVGEREQRDRTVSLRERSGGDKGAIPLDDFVRRVTEENGARR